MDCEEDVLEHHYDFLDSDLLKLKIKQTLLPFKGLGLFAAGEFQKGEVIAQYYGSILSGKASESELFNEEDKLVQIDEQVCVIGRCPASRINDIVDFNSERYGSPQYTNYKDSKKFPTIKGFSTNARLALDSKQKVFIKSTKPILGGEQIYMEYGFSYWDFFHEYEYKHKHGSNNKIDEKLL